MQEMKGLVKYHLHQYFRTNRFVMPFAVLLFILYSIYSSHPAKVVNNILISNMFVFLIMVWVGVTACDLENEVSEQILILRVQSKWKYYFSHVIFLLVIGAFISLLAILFPVLQDLANSRHFFTRALCVSDVLYGFVLLLFSGYAGCSLGELSHPRIIKERKTAVISILLAAVVSLTKGSIIEKFPFLKLGLWIFPPISELSSVFANSEYFYLGKMAIGVVILLMSGTFLTLVKIRLLIRRGF